MSRRSLVLLAGAALCILGFIWKMLQKANAEQPIDGFARAAIAAVETQDADAVFRKASPLEISRLNISVDKYRRLLAWYRDAIQPFNSCSRTEVQVGAQGYYALGSARYSNGSNIQPILQIACMKTPSGPTAYFVFPIVSTALYAKYGKDFASKPEAERSWYSLQEGLVKEGAFLNSIGISGYMDEHADGRVISWQTLETFTTTAIETAQAKERRASRAVQSNGSNG